MKLTSDEQVAAREVFDEAVAHGYTLTEAQQQLYDRMTKDDDAAPDDYGVRAAPQPASDDMVQILCFESAARSIEARLAPRVRLSPPLHFGEDATPTYILQPEGTY